MSAKGDVLKELWALYNSMRWDDGDRLEAVVRKVLADVDTYRSIFAVAGESAEAPTAPPVESAWEPGARYEEVGQIYQNEHGVYWREMTMRFVDSRGKVRRFVTRLLA